MHVFSHDAVFQGKILVEGAENIDWQDLAIGPGPQDGVDYIYVGDIGDQDGNRSTLVIYRFPEPDLAGLTAPFEVSVSDFERIEFTINEARSCETLMLDARTKDLIVLGKMQAMVYRLPYPQKVNEVYEADFKGHHRLQREIKAGDMSPDGSEIIIKDVGQIFHWTVEEGEDPVQVMFEKPATFAEYRSEIEGGALGWSADGNAYFTITDTDLSEDGVTRRGQPIIFGYTRR